MTSLSTPCPAFHLPSTSDFVAYHAAHSPDKVAIGNPTKTYSYQQIHHDLVRVTAALKKTGLSSGQFALVYHTNLYVHILLLLACENLRVMTASLSNVSPTILEEKAHIILSEIPTPDLKLPTHQVDEAWFKSVSNGPYPDDTQDAPSFIPLDHAVRVTRSSGTTGNPKLIRINRWQFEYAIQAHIRDKRISQDTVMLVAYGMDIFNVWGQVNACLRSGGTALWGDPLMLSKEYNFTLWWLMPLALGNLIRHLSSKMPRQNKLTIFTAGAPLSENLRQAALANICHAIGNGYGTNETGGICKFENNNQGVLRPGVEVKVVDEMGRRVPFGEEGILALKTPAMSHEYWLQPEYTAKYFKDGWFYPGDRGILLSQRILKHLGRADEMLNFGGIKQSPETLESLFQKMPEVTEVAASSFTRPDGVDVLLLALVLKDPASALQVKQAAITLLGALVNHTQFIFCDRLPRTSNGKIKRSAIRELTKNQT